MTHVEGPLEAEVKITSVGRIGREAEENFRKFMNHEIVDSTEQIFESAMASREVLESMEIDDDLIYAANWNFHGYHNNEPHLKTVSAISTIAYTIIVKNLFSNPGWWNEKREKKFHNICERFSHVKNHAVVLTCAELLSIPKTPTTMGIWRIIPPTDKVDGLLEEQIALLDSSLQQKIMSLRERNT